MHTDKCVASHIQFTNLFRLFYILGILIINQMGYAEVGQTGRGLHLRQYSRAFIFVKGDTRIVLVTAEVQAVGIAVRREVTISHKK